MLENSLEEIYPRELAWAWSMMRSHTANMTEQEVRKEKQKKKEKSKRGSNLTLCMDFDQHWCLETITVRRNMIYNQIL